MIIKNVLGGGDKFKILIKNINLCIIIKKMTFEMDNIDITEQNILDDSWINDFERNDNPYNEFYKDNIFTVNINIFYINKDNEIEKVTEEVFLMQTQNLISREEIIGIIKKNSIMNDNNYSLLSIIKYNIVLNPQDITMFLKTSKIDYYNDYFFTTLKHIDTIYFEKTINMFQDLNTLFIIFYEKDKNNESASSIKNNTKKIYLRRVNPKSKKTIRR
jgi:hypothetical protein